MNKIVTVLIFISCFKLFSQTPVVLWEQNYLSPNSYFQSITKTDDGDFVLQAFEGNFPSVTNFPILKINTDGNLIWNVINNGVSYSVDSKKNIVQHNDNHIYLIDENYNTSTANNFSLYQYNSLGVLINHWSYPYSDKLTISKLINTNDNGFLAVGSINVINPIQREIGWVVKIDAFKNIEWVRLLNDSSEINSKIYAAVNIVNGEFLIAGYQSENNMSDSNYYLAKLSQDGFLIWERTFGGSENEDVRSIIELANGNFLLLGSTLSTDGDVSNNNGIMNVWAVITDVSGNLVSQSIITNNDIAYAEATAIAESDGGYTVGIMSNCNESINSNSFYLKRLNSNHEEIWNFCGSLGFVYDIVKSDEDEYIVVGNNANSSTNNHQAKAIKIGIVLDNESFALQNTSFYPNPVKDILHIKSDIVFNHVIIYTVDGRKVMMEQIQNNQINVEKLPQNLYIAKLVSANEQEINLKFVKN
jgi:hypothetical protein